MNGSLVCGIRSFWWVKGSLLCVIWSLLCVNRSLLCVIRSLLCVIRSLLCVSGSLFFARFASVVFVCVFERERE